MLATTSFLLALIVLPFVTAVPVGPPKIPSPPLPQSFRSPGFHCPLAGAKIDVPAGQGLAVPAGTPKIVALGVGTQVRYIPCLSYSPPISR